VKAPERGNNHASLRTVAEAIVGVGLQV
jgi:hypothetical protein